MPKNPNIRKRREKFTNNDPVAVEVRKKWLDPLKNWAVGQLPPSAPAHARVHLRQTVEQHLSTYGPGSPLPEIHDILRALVDEAKLELEKGDASQTNAGMSAKRKQWLDHWKDQAIAQLPSTASYQTKAALRQSIEETLKNHGPESLDSEIQDLVGMVVVKTTFQLEAEEAERERTSRKNDMMELCEKLLALAIQRFPSHLVGAPVSWQRAHLVEQLQSELRIRLADRLTGEETLDDLGSIVKAFVGGWEKSLNTNQQVEGSISRRVLLTGVAAAAGAGIMMRFPFLKEKMKKGADFVRTQVPWDEVIQTVSEAYKKTNPDKANS